MIEDSVIFYGHRNVSATNRRTFEITSEKDLTPRGDCIIGVRANKSCSTLDPIVRSALSSGERAELTIETGDFVLSMKAEGSTLLTLTDPISMVIRKSHFSSPRTLVVGADMAAADFPRGLAKLLQDPMSEGRLTIRVFI
ncbi:MAG: hypothetical protein CMO12_01055 [Thaumarchaeota archaeon]|nr:hypothetical protein [Nitrososphaerota archaeon]